ncbi:hypothetical protein BC940DRAFT_297027 [Gongronella butleri]|nr:hypothetical protein BC940DRAFT_297027 [Gongronella butleri]
MSIDARTRARQFRKRSLFFCSLVFFCLFLFAPLPALGTFQMEWNEEDQKSSGVIAATIPAGENQTFVSAQDRFVDLLSKKIKKK